MGGICHEINNPLTILLGNLGILEKFIKKDPPPSPEKLLSFTSEINTSSKRIQEIVSTLRQLASPDQVEENAEVYFETLFEQIQIFLKTKINREKIEIFFENEAKTYKLNCRQALVIEALLQIVLNRIEAQKEFEKKWVSFKVFVENNQFKLFISDASNTFSAEDKNAFNDQETSSTNSPNIRLVIAKQSLEATKGQLQLLTKGKMNGTLITLQTTTLSP